MSEIRLYRKFNCYNTELNGIVTKQLITPTSLSIHTINTGTNAIVESGPTLVLESQGFYYASLDASLYTFDQIYKVVWTVTYIPDAPEKILKTRFKLNPVNIASRLDTEIYSPTIEIELISNY